MGAPFLLILLFLGGSYQSALGETTITVLGDSLTEGYGVTKEEAFPALLETQLQKEFPKIKVVAAGISGSTSASGPQRLKWILKSKPTILILALGSNDGLRGLPLEQLKKNLADTIVQAQASEVKVVLAGLKVPPNYGKRYSVDFENVFKDLAKKYRLPLIPFLLEGVAGDKNMNIADGIHPNQKGHLQITKNVLDILKPLLSKEVAK